MVELYSTAVSSRYSVVNRDGCMALDSKASRDTCLAAMYCSVAEVDDGRKAPRPMWSHCSAWVYDNHVCTLLDAMILDSEGS